MAILQALEHTDDRRDQTVSPRYVIYEDDIDGGARGESPRYVRHENEPRPGRVEEVIVYSKPKERPRSSGVYSSSKCILITMQ